MSKSSFYRKCSRFLGAAELENGAEHSDEHDDVLPIRYEYEIEQNEKVSKITIPIGRL